MIERACRAFLGRFARRVHRVQRFFLAYPRTTLIVALCAMLIALIPATKLRTLIVIDDLIDPDFRTYASMDTLRKEFPNKNNLLLIVKRKSSGEIPSSSELCDLLGWMNRIPTEFDGIEKVYSSFGIQLATDRDNQVQLTPVLRKHCGRYGTDAEEAAAVKGELDTISRSAYGPFLSSRSADDVMLTFYLRDHAEDERFGKFNYQLVDKLKDFFQKNYLDTHPNMTAIWGGMGSYQHYLKIGYDQSLLLNGLAALLLLVLFRFLYGTWIAAFLFESTLIFTLSIVYGLMGYLDWPIDNLTNVLPTLLMVATLEDFVFLCALRKSAGMSTSRALRKLTVPSFFTSLTTAIGFGSLCITDLSIIQRFGAVSALGAMLEWFATICLLPALVNVFPRLDHWMRPSPNWIERVASKGSTRVPPRWVGYAALAVIPFSVLFYSKLNVNDAPEEIFSDSHPFSKSIQYLRESRGWSSEISLMFKDFGKEAENRAIIQKIKATDPNVVAIEDPYAIRDAITEGVSEQHRSTFNGIWAGSPFASRLVSQDSDRARALLFLKSTDIVQVNAMRARIEPICGLACELAGSLNSYGEFGERVLNTLLESLGSSVIEVSIVLLPLCLIRSQKRSWLVILASMWGVFAMMSLYIIFQIKVFFITSVVASIMVGLAGDSPIQFLYSKKRSGSVSSGVDLLSGASLTVTILMSATSSVLFFSSFSFIRTLAGLMILGLFLLFVGDVFLLKSLLETDEKPPK